MKRTQGRQFRPVMRIVNMEKRIANLLNSCKESNILEKESIQIKDLISDYFANEDVDGFSSESDTDSESRDRTTKKTTAGSGTSGASVSVLFNDSETDSDTEIEEPDVSICGPGETSEDSELKDF